MTSEGERDIFGKVSPTGTWDHRRGEPRTFAFLWVGFLVVATLFTLIGSGAAGVLTPESFRPNARLLLTGVALGGCLLWPMFRLCQRLPACGGVAACARDLLIVVIGSQAVVWPQRIQPAQWPMESMLALAAFIPAWFLIVGGLLAWALGPGVRGGSVRDAVPRTMEIGGGVRAAYMGAFVVLALGAAAGVAAMGAPSTESAAPARLGWLASPVTGVYELTRERVWLGQLVTIESDHWVGIGLVAGVGVLAWIPALARQRRDDAGAAGAASDVEG